MWYWRFYKWNWAFFISKCGFIVEFSVFKYDNKGFIHENIYSKEDSYGLRWNLNGFSIPIS